MKIRAKWASVVALASSLLFGATAAWAQQNVLTAEEAADLTFMREEEKMARDVYLTLHAKWEQAIFANIAESEQSHVDAVGALLDKYKLPDPMLLDQPGVFVNADLQALYDQLINGGNESLMAALRVGALIEETDILDIQAAIDRTDQRDIVRVYENLLAGSRNHLRAFVGQIESQGVAYVPQLLDEDALSAIVDAPMERGSRR